MTPHSRLTPDERQLATTHLCPSCCKRILTFAPNERYVAPPQRERRPQPRPGDKRRRIIDIAALDDIAAPEPLEVTIVRLAQGTTTQANAAAN